VADGVSGLAVLYAVLTFNLIAYGLTERGRGDSMKRVQWLAVALACCCLVLRDAPLDWPARAGIAARRRAPHRRGRRRADARPGARLRLALVTFEQLLFETLVTYDDANRCAAARGALDGQRRSARYPLHARRAT
jgi:hypothetical protein